MTQSFLSSAAVQAQQHLPLSIQGLTVRDRNQVIIEDLWLDLQSGQTTALLGPNGAGKSTLMHALMGLVPLSSGSASILGHDITTSGVQARNHTMLISDSIGLLEDFTALEHFEYGQDMRSAWDQNQALEVAKQFGLPLNQPARRLSKGQRMALRTAFAFGAQPELLLLDEPTNGLDPENRSRFLSLMVDFVATGGTVLIATHVLSEIETIADRLVIMKRGTLLMNAEMEELRQHRNLLHVNFDRELTDAETTRLRNVPGVYRMGTRGRSLTLHVRGEVTLLTQMIEQEFPVQNIHIQPLTLEQVYVETMGGQL
ncbi:ABC transporter ATP-binding protein [Deinococcus cellulosilyticus]|uniref:ABC transporter ATP-binding protein n=1 Tax=Deinococcus cellulosilyticus (strain DSM 18568 / NBRC 106333 / KACC 11606 / 5516J-15) TaxID=1223518 RepID=A0A511N5X3_DEIC1|nr:ABC transporter ATP-binding protein [Deinococcus cellulosilyticus]GEM48262.1 ABC transporter ATP-binding protein [Deinococcus cellulosilyticus NBRC 106333 = KACC 11606]